MKRSYFSTLFFYLLPMLSIAQVGEIKDPLNIEIGTQGKSLTQPKVNGGGLTLDAVAPYSKANFSISSIRPGTLNGKNYIDLDLKITALPGFMLSNVFINNFEDGMEPLIIASWLLNLQGRYQQNYLGRTLSIAVGPFYFGVNSEAEFDAKKRLSLGFGFNFSKLTPSDFLNQKIHELGPVNLKAFSGREDLVFDGHLNDAQVADHIRSEVQNNPDKFNLIESEVDAYSLLNGETISLTGAILEANIPINNKKQWDVNFGLSYQDAYKSTGSNDINFNKYQATEQIPNSGNVEAYRNVTLVQSVQGSTRANVSYQHFQANLGTSFLIKKVRVWLDGAYDFNQLSIHTPFQSTNIKFDQLSFAAGVKIPINTKIGNKK